MPHHYSGGHLPHTNFIFADIKLLQLQNVKLNLVRFEQKTHERNLNSVYLRGLSEEAYPQNRAIPIQYQEHWTTTDSIAETVLPGHPPRVNSTAIQENIPSQKALGKSQQITCSQFFSKHSRLLKN